MLTITLRGLVHGTGTNLDILTSTNLWQPPDLNVDYHRRDRAHGVDGGLELFGGRRISVTVQIVEDTMALALAALRELSAAWSISSENLDLGWVDDLGSFRLSGRPQLAAPNMENADVGLITAECRFLATDPLIYSSAEVTASTGRVVQGAGVTPPFVVPFTLGASTPGTARVSNVGTGASPWTGRLDGPLVNPVIRNLMSGQVLDFRANGGLSLATGEFVDLASDGQGVLFAGVADRSILLDVASRWWACEPGNTDFELTADSGAGTLSVTTWDGWV